jgi:hypothetical protein
MEATAPEAGRGFATTAPLVSRTGSLAVSNEPTIRILPRIRPPFSPEAVIDEFSALLKTYRITSVHGDKYGGEFPRELYRKRGIKYRCCDKVKSDLYRDMLPLLNSGRITLPKSDRLVQHTHVRFIHLATSSIPLQSA